MLLVVISCCMDPIPIPLRSCILLLLLLPMSLKALAQEPAGDISGVTQPKAPKAVDLKGWISIAPHALW